MQTFRKYSNLLFVPAMLIILLSFLSGFTGKTEENTVKELLRERTRILQNCYYGLMDRNEAEKALFEIETYPLLSSDIQSLREWDETEVDIVEKMYFGPIQKTRSCFGKDAYQVAVKWEVSGLSGDYVAEGDYHIILKTEKNRQFLSVFVPLS